MTPDVPSPHHRALGAILRRRREHLRMTRQQVTDAGGPSPATIQRIENGEIKTEIAPATKRDLEAALELPAGWIDRYLAGDADEPPTGNGEQHPAIIEGEGERILVAITDGVSRLTVAERRAVLALVRGLHKASPD